MKRIAGKILIFIVISVFGFIVRSYAEESESGEFITSGDYRYVLLDDGNAEIVAYMGREESVIVPGSLDDYVVTSIGDKAFFACPSLSSITLPDNLTSIGDGAFSNCFNLNSISLPDSLTSIGDFAFSACSSLSSITLPDSLTSIGNYAFSYCFSLNSITLPDSLTSIGDRAFVNCSSLSSITLPDSLTNIVDNAFTGCDALTVTVTRDSYAEEYCVENSLKYMYTDSLDWLNQ